MSKFSEYLTGFNLVLLGLIVSYVAGVVTSQKVKDYLAGVPAEARATLKALEADALGKLAAARTSVLADLRAKFLPAPKVAAPAPAPAATVVVAAAPAPAAPTAAG